MAWSYSNKSQIVSKPSVIFHLNQKHKRTVYTPFSQKKTVKNYATQVMFFINIECLNRITRSLTLLKNYSNVLGLKKPPIKR